MKCFMLHVYSQIVQLMFSICIKPNNNRLQHLNIIFPMFYIRPFMCGSNFNNPLPLQVYIFDIYIICFVIDTLVSWYNGYHKNNSINFKQFCA